MRTALLIFVLGLLGVLSAPAALAASGDEEAPPAERVLVLSLPRVQWADVVAAGPPSLVELLGRSAIASMSVRTLGAITTSAEAYATLGGGNRVAAGQDVGALAFPAGAEVGGNPAAIVLERACDCSSEGAAVVHLGIQEIAARNDRLLYGAEPGSLGAALAEAGRTAAVVANADADAVHREAALGAIDHQGRIPVGTVGPELLAAHPHAPFGLRTDVEATVDAFREAWAVSDMVLLEVSDLERADRWRSDGGPSSAGAHRQSLAGSERLLQEVLSSVDLDRHLVLVVAPSEHRGAPVALTVGAVAGPGIEPGLATSGTTRRDGYVSLPDVAPTVLRSLGVDLPSSMNGAAITSTGGGAPDIARFEQLADDNEVAVFRNRVTGPVTVAFIILQVVAYSLAIAAVTSTERRRRFRRWVIALNLTVIAGPTVAFLSGLFRYDGLGPAGYLVAFFVVSAAVAGAAVALVWVARRRGPPGMRAAVAGTGILVPPLVLAALLLGTLLVDIVAGGPLQIDTVFGYSPIVAGRFAGFGNQAFGLVAMAAIVFASGAWGAMLLATADPPTRVLRLRLAAVAGLFTVTVLAVGMPQFGLDVGGVLSAVPAFLITCLLLAGVALGARRLALVAMSTIGVLTAFAAFDLLRPVEARTHLGRFLVLAGDEGLSGVSTVIERKVNSNLFILTSSIWTLFIPVLLAALVFLVWRRPAYVSRLERRMPGTRACLIGALVVAVLGALVNDSGVAVPGIMFAVLLPYLALLSLSVSGEPTAAPPGC